MLRIFKGRSFILLIIYCIHKILHKRCMDTFQDDPGEERMNRSNPLTLRRCSGRDHSASSWQAGRVNGVFRMMYPERKARHAVPLQRKRKKRREYWIPAF
ncbi:hypothetical protein KAU15_01700, partial [candidate division WOR-3 bacterium]|nr:hypothetical protein [candidate division WOR-3 bacterium]